ncbi:hypothetical protein C8R43DRAFT_975243 [Mycena crocata]|nr:hypothetical protein C8R43DRAFT_975243 [Mycena crocata]
MCERDPRMSLYQPIAASAVEVCAAAKLDQRSATAALAVYAVDKVALLIHFDDIMQASSAERQVLESLERSLDSIRRHIENLPRTTSQSLNPKTLYKFHRSANQLKAELKGHLNAISEKTTNTSTIRLSSRNDNLIELAAVSIRVAGAICEAPGLTFVKPVVGIVALICDTAKSVKSNREAAADLAKHASDVMSCVVDRVQESNWKFPEESLNVLRLALENIQTYLVILHKRRRPVSWVLAAQERDRVFQLNQALDKALALLTASQVLGTLETVQDIGQNVQANTNQIGALALTVNDFESGVNRTLTTIHCDVEKLLLTSANKGDARSNSLVSFRGFPCTDLFFSDLLAAGTLEKVLAPALPGILTLPLISDTVFRSHSFPIHSL